MPQDFHKRLVSFFAILSLLLSGFSPLLAIDDLFNFEKQYLAERIEYEKTRRLCLFPFRQNGSDAKAKYLQSGLPSVLYSQLSKIKYVFAKDVTPEIIYHEFGKAKRQKRKNNKFWNRKKLEDLNAGKKKLAVDQDPRFIRLSHKLYDTIEAPIPGSELALAQKYKCFYAISGSFRKSGEDSLEVQVQVLERKRGSKQQFSHQSSFRRSYQEMQPLIGKLAEYFTPVQNTRISVTTGKTENILVYLDETYLGKSPIKNYRAPPGKHKLVLMKEGYLTSRHNIQLKAGKNSKYALEIQKIPQEGKISVTSEPNGANVYLGITYLGKTPLTDMPVPSGVNRIRVSAEGHIDYFTGVDIKKDETLAVQAKLKPGKTSVYYRNQFNLFLDYTYFDFAIYSLYSVLLFYGGYAYFDIEANRTSDQLRTEVFLDQFSLLAFVSSLSGQTTESTTAFASQLTYESIKLQQNQRKVRNLQSLRDASGVAAASMLFMAAGFYYFGYSRESLDFGFSWQPGRVFHSRREASGQFHLSHHF
ncbi:MAG: PEGA domain-containing protein [Spirochaetota bacterium]